MTQFEQITSNGLVEFIDKWKCPPRQTGATTGRIEK